MQHFNLGEWTSRHRTAAYVVVPLVLGALMLGLYFSGSTTLQQ